MPAVTNMLSHLKAICGFHIPSYFGGLKMTERKLPSVCNANPSVLASWRDHASPENKPFATNIPGGHVKKFAEIQKVCHEIEGVLKC